MFIYNDTIDPGDVIVVSDIHGCYDQYARFLDWVRDSGACVIICGDLVDRGPDDLGVLERTYDLMQDPDSWGLGSFTAITGNHEILLLNAIDGYGMIDWVRNGGDYERLDQLEEHSHWIRKLPYYVTVGDTLYSHCGVIPGQDPQLSMDSFYLREEFVWNRGSFLRVGPQFEKWSPTLRKVVFGHTPRKDAQPWEVPNGICIDSGCYFSGVLTAYNATQDTFTQFSIE
jgi:hypothetical protein